MCESRFTRSAHQQSSYIRQPVALHFSSLVIIDSSNAIFQVKHFGPAIKIRHSRVEALGTLAPLEAYYSDMNSMKTRGCPIRYILHYTLTILKA